MIQSEVFTMKVTFWTVQKMLIRSYITKKKINKTWTHFHYIHLNMKQERNSTLPEGLAELQCPHEQASHHRQPWRNIRHETAVIPADMLQLVFDSSEHRVQLRVNAWDDQFQLLLRRDAVPQGLRYVCPIDWVPLSAHFLWEIQTYRFNTSLSRWLGKCVDDEKLRDVQSIVTLKLCSGYIASVMNN